MEVGVTGLSGVNAACMGRFKERETVTILPLSMVIHVKERPTRKRIVVRIIHL